MSPVRKREPKAVPNITIPAQIDGVWVETVVVIVKDGYYEARRFSQKPAGSGEEFLLKEDVEIWRAMGCEVIIERES